MRSSVFCIALAVGVLAASSAWADPAPSAPPPVIVPPAPSAEAPTLPPPPGAPEDERTAENALYIEGLGPGLFWSVNYDRSFGDFAARVGFGYVSFGGTVTSGDASSGGTTQETSSASFFAIPVTVSYLGLGSKKSMLELGAGATIWHIGAGFSSVDAKSSSSDNASATIVLPVGIVGYRYQPPKGGFLFRAGVSPIFAGSMIAVLPWPYVGLGATF